MQRILIFLTTTMAALSAAPASACPYCSEGIRKQVIAGVFDERFGHNLLFTLAPFVVFGGLAAAIHFSGPQRVDKRKTSNPSSRNEPEQPGLSE